MMVPDAFFTGWVYFFVCSIVSIRGQDVSVSQFTYTLSSAKFYNDVNFKIYYSTTFENLLGTDINAVTGKVYNFGVEVLISDADVSSAQTNNLGLAAFSGTVDSKDKAKLQAGLSKSDSSAGPITLNGYASANIPTAKISLVKYVCIHVIKGQGASYGDSNDDNNYKCIDISSDLGQKADTADLSVIYYMLVNDTVSIDTFVSLDLHMKVTLYGSTTLIPANNPYSIYAYLSVDNQLNTAIDLRLTEVPLSFDKVTMTSFTSNGQLDLSGTGLRIPNNTMFCGPVYLIIHLDGKGAIPGQIPEVNEENNIMAKRLVILCPGELRTVCATVDGTKKDNYALRDFTYDLGLYQNYLFVEAYTPIWVSATVFNVNPEGKPFQPGPANFKLLIYLNQYEDLSQGAPIEVTWPGVTYYGLESPQKGIPVGESIKIKNAKIWVDGAKFTDKNNKYYLILKAVAPDGSSSEDNITANNFASSAIAVSTFTKLEQGDYIINPTIKIRQNAKSAKLIKADNTQKLESKLDSLKKPTGQDTFSFEVLTNGGDPTGHVSFPPKTTISSLITKLYWSADDIFDPEKDEAVDVTLSLQSKDQKGLIVVSSSKNLEPPTDKQLCGTITAIVYTDKPITTWEKLEYNNFGMDTVRLQCSPSDTLGITEASITRELLYIWADTPTTLSLSLDISCTRTTCNYNGGSSKTFQLVLYIDDGNGNKNQLIAIDDNSKIKKVTNNGLNVVLTPATGYRQQITFDVDVTIAQSDCKAADGKLGIELKKADGSADGYTPNDYILLPLPPMECSASAPAMDLVPTTFTLKQETGNTLHPGQRIPFTLDATLTLKNSKTLPDIGLTQFTFKLYLEDSVTQISREIPYALTDCQIEQVKKPFTAASSNLDLKDTRGFIIPTRGFETFCKSSSVNVIVALDSYDLYPDDDIEGQLRETQETNNMMIATNGPFSLHKNVIDCSHYLVTTSPKLDTTLINFQGPDFVFPEHGLTYTFELAVVNAYTKPIRGGSQSTPDFSIKAYLAGDYNRTATYQSFIVTVAADHEEFRWLGLESGGRRVFQITARLCQSATSPCTSSNVLDASECTALIQLQPQILFGVSQIRLALENDGYSAQDPLFSHTVDVKCQKHTMFPTILSIVVPTKLMRDSTYKIPFSVNVTNLAPSLTSTLFNGPEAKFNIGLWLSEDGVKKDLALTVPYTVAEWPMLATGMGLNENVTLSGEAGMNLSPAPKCDLFKNTIYIRAEVISLATTLVNQGYVGGTYAFPESRFTNNYTATCSNDFVDVSVKDFSLENATVIFGNKIGYTLVINIETSGSMNLQGSVEKYNVKFYMSFDKKFSSDDVEISSPFQSTQLTKMKSAVGNNANKDEPLSSQNNNEKLDVSPAVGGKYCFQRNFFIIAKSTLVQSGKVDSDSLNDEKAVAVSVNCIGDLFMIESATVQPLALMQYTGLEVLLDVTVANTHPDEIDIPASMNNKDNFYFQLYAGSSSPTLIPLTSQEIPAADQTKLKQGIPANGKIMLKQIKFLAQIDSVTCTKINSESQFSVRARYGLGLPYGYVDTIPENNEFKFTSASCTADTADLSVTSFSLQQDFTPETGKFGKQGFTLKINLQLTGSHSFTSGSTNHFVFRMFLSHDQVLDINKDKELPLDMNNYKADLSAAYNTQGSNTINIQANGNKGVIYPSDIKENYCGHSYLIAWVDSNQNIIETVESNNEKAINIYLNCDNDLYQLDDVTISSQQKYFPDIAAPFEFSASVYNVRKSTSQIPTSAQPNYKFTVFAQFGPVYDPKYATDLTTSTNWTVKSSELAQLTNQFSQNAFYSYTHVRRDITITNSLCDLGFDHLVVLVENVPSNGLSECLMYNNFYSYPITCGGSNSLDVRLNLDRQGMPVFELIGDKNIVLGTPKPFSLKVDVEVKGNAGWAAQLSSAPPKFKYEFAFIDDVNAQTPKKIKVPYEINNVEINKATLATRTLDLSGTFNLSIADFLPFCQSLPNLRLFVYLDVDNQLVESNELNNQLSIGGVTIGDGGKSTCSAGTDLVASSLELRPYGPTYEVRVGTAFQAEFTYTATSDPGSFKYQLILSEDGMASNPTNYVGSALNSDHTHSSGTKVDISSMTIQSSDSVVLRFCGQRPFLGIQLDSLKAVAEVNEDNNYAWTQIIFTCPGINSLGLLNFSIDPANILRDSTPLSFKFSTSVVNKGQDIAKGSSGVNFNFVLYLASSMQNVPNTGTSVANTSATITGADNPDRADKFLAGNVWSYKDAIATFTLLPAQCVGMNYVCLSLEPVGISEFEGDNVLCLDITTGPIVLDCTRDISFSTLTYSLQTIEIFEDTAVPVTFNTNLTFTGRQVPATKDGASHIGFKVFLSDRDNKVPTTLEGGSEIEVDNRMMSKEGASKISALSQGFTSAEQIPIELKTSVTISTALCATTGRFLCLEYVWLTVLSPMFREGNPANDFVCVDVSSVMGCHKNTKDIEPLWLGFENDGLVIANELTNFELIVNVDLRGEGTGGKLPFAYSFFVSNKETLDQTAVKLDYNGFQYDKPAEELRKYMRVGLHSLNLGGVPINISVDLATQLQFCGDAYIFFESDSNKSIPERYEDNNIISSPVIIQCPGDYLGISIRNFSIPDGIWAGVNESLITFNWAIPYRTLSPDGIDDITSDPSHTFELYASDSATWGSGSQTLVSSQYTRNTDINQWMEQLVDNSLNPYQRNMLQGVMMHVDGSLFTTSICSSTTHLFVCVKYLKETEATTLISNNCKGYGIDSTQKSCTGYAAQRDLKLMNMRVPGMIDIPSQIMVQHDIQITIGTAALPIRSGDFISYLYLSKKSEWDKTEALKIAELPNIIEQEPGTVDIKKVTNENVAIAELTDKSYCGHVYAYIVVDAAGDIMESSTTNNIGKKQINVLCNGDYFSLSNVEMKIPEGYLVDNTVMEVDIKFDVTCMNCSIPMSVQDNIIVSLSSGGTSHHYPDIRSKFLSIGDETFIYIDDLLDKGISAGSGEYHDNLWAMDDTSMFTPDWLGVGYSAPGFTRHFAITSKKLAVPQDHCPASGINNFTISLKFGPMLNGIMDTVPENQQATLSVKCMKASSRDLIAHPTTILKTTSDFNNYTPCLKCASKILYGTVVGNPGESSRTQGGLSSPGVFLSPSSNDYNRVTLSVISKVAAEVRQPPKTKYGVALPEPGHKFNLKIELVGNKIQSTDALLTATPFTIEFYVSMDSTLSYDDISLSYTLSDSVASDLRNGINANSSLSVIEFIQGIEIPSYICGYRYIIVFLDNTNRIKEATKSNNFAATKVFVDCVQDIFEVVDYKLKQPKAFVFPDQPTEVSISVALRYNSVNGVDSDGTMFQIRGYLSADEKWDPLVDSLQPMPDLSNHMGLLTQPLKKGDYRVFSDITFPVNMTSADCTHNNRYLLIVVLPLGKQAIKEGMMENNWMSRALNARCGVNVDLRATITLTGPSPAKGGTIQAALTIDKTGDIPAPLTMADVTTSLYLSQDTRLDPDVDVSVQIISGVLTIPADLPLYLCGKIYLLADVDDKNIVSEYDETNNLGSTSITIVCPNDMFNLLDLSVTYNGNGTANIDTPNPVTMQVKVVCTRTDGTCPAAPVDSNQVHYTFKVKVYDSNQYEVGSVIPSTLTATWVTTVNGDSDDFTGFEDADGLRKSYGGSIKEWSLVIKDKFQLANKEVCERVKYIGLELVKGDSTEMASKSLGPAAANTRVAPFMFDCRRSTIDLSVGGFAITGKTINVSLGYLMLNTLQIDLTAKNMPPNVYNRTLFNYKFYISETSATIADGTDLEYIMPKAILDLISVARETKTFNIHSVTPQIPVAANKMKHLCGKKAYIKILDHPLKDLAPYQLSQCPHMATMLTPPEEYLTSHLTLHIVVLNPYNEVKEVNTNNNIMVEEVTVGGCPIIGDMDQTVLSLKSPPIITPGEMTLSVDVKMRTVLIGPKVGIFIKDNPTAQRYTVKFDLIDNIENPQKVFSLNVDMSQYTDLTKDMLPSDTSDAQIGVATVFNHLLTGIAVPIPSDYVICGQSWFLHVTSSLFNATLDSNLKDNSRFEHLRIVCPDDRLALASVEVTYMPSKWWSESINIIELYTSVVNQGDDINNQQNSLFSIKQYFSLDDVFDENTDTLLALKDRGGHSYEEFGSIKSKQIKTSGLLSGELKVATNADCLKAKEADSKPTIFWKLVPSEESFSNATQNDIMKMAVNKSTLVCSDNNVDLMVYEVDINSTLNAEKPISFVISLRQTKTLKGFIGKSNFASKDVSFKVEFYLSNDMYYGPDDVLIDFTYDSQQLNILQQGVSDQTEEFIPFRGNNLEINPTIHPQYAFYCGQSYLAVKVTDVQNMNSPKDPVPENNIMVKPIQLLCAKDVVSFDSLVLTPVIPQKQLYHSTNTLFNMNATIQSYATETLNNSLDTRYIFEFRAFMSVDAVLDVQRDPEIILTLPEVIKTQFLSGFKPGEKKVFQGEVTINVHEVVCSYAPKYMIILIQKWSQFYIKEDIVSNNFQYIDISSLFNCGVTKGDLFIDKFNFTTGTDYTPGATVNFDLVIRAKLYGQMVLGIAGVLNVSLSTFMQLDYQFYLSTDEKYDSTDESLNYDKTQQPTVKLLIEQLLNDTFITVAQPVFTLPGSMMIPESMGAQYCGHVYILGVVDQNYIANEINEHNNVNPISVFIKCHNDVFELSSISMDPQPLLYKGPGYVRMFMNLFNLLSQDITAETDSTFGQIQVYVESDSPKVINHEVTPARMEHFFTSEQEEFTGGLLSKEKKIFTLKTFISLASACDAERDPINSGTINLMVEFNQGNNSQFTTLADSMPYNNMYGFPAKVTCTPAMIDLYVKNINIHGLEFGPTASKRLSFGNNPFQLVVAAAVSGGAGWDIGPSGPNDPARFVYTFQYTVISLKWGPQKAPYKVDGEVQYDSQVVKANINADTRNNKDIDLSESNMGWYMPKKDYLILCLLKETDAVIMTVSIDTKHEISEVDEGNNTVGVTLHRPVDSECTDAYDFKPSTFLVKNTQSDVFKTDKNHTFELKIMLILVGSSSNFDTLPANNPSQHFEVQVYMSFDQVLDGQDILLDIPWTQSQISAFKMHAIGLDFMDLSDSNLLIPLNNMTYQYCWEPVYLLAQVDSTDKKNEANEDNNIKALGIVLDCGAEVNECTAGYDNCHIDAKCIDLPFNLYTQGQGFKCECKPGYKGNGTFCENIDECIQNATDGSPLHDCHTITNSHCEDTIGSFKCVCNQGYTGDGKCMNLNECQSSLLNKCDPNAVCSDNIGSYICMCQTGFQGDGWNCTNVNDCKPDSCQNGGTCKDAVRSVECICADYYEGDFCEVANGNWGEWNAWGTCLSDCGSSIHNRTRQCNNPAPTTTGLLKGRPCLTDNNNIGHIEYNNCSQTACKSTLNWCESDPCNKAQGGICIRTNGGSSFQCECKDGYTRHPPTGQFLRCDDKDECKLKTDDCHLLATCHNTIGSYDCVCGAGYQGNGKVCEDIDECKTGQDKCDENAQCINKPVLYDCVCKEGFKKEKVGDPVHGKCVGKRLFDYGEAYGDINMKTVSQVTGERVSPLIPVPHGLPMAGGTILNSLYISENGLIVGTMNQVPDMNNDTYRLPKNLATFTFDSNSANKALIAPLWADVKTDNTSDVWYQVYTDKSNPIYSKLEERLKQTANLTDSVDFILKVTWRLMQPVYETTGNEMNTFQAIVATDYHHSYVIFIYEAEGMTWYPVYTATEINIKYDGYPAWIGFTSQNADGTMYRPTPNINSGKWSVDPSQPNAYRVDSKMMHPGQMGVVAYRMDTNVDSHESNVNPRESCYEWYMSEPAPSVWGSTIVGSCPSIEAQANVDLRFIPDNMAGQSEKCFTLRFPLDSGSTIRCCYMTSTGSLITAKENNNGSTLTDYTQVGFVSRYPKSQMMNSSHYLKDILPFSWCCLDSKNYSSSYCNMYLLKRPMSNSDNYDSLHLGFIHGDPHFHSIDGFLYTYNGFSEYVMLASKSDAPIYLMVQARTSMITMDNAIQDPIATKLGAVSVQVGSSSAPKIQIYLKQVTSRAEIVIYVDNQKYMSSSPPSTPGIYIQQEGATYPTWANIVFKEGIWLQVKAEKIKNQELMNVTFAIPSSFKGKGYTGLWGSFDGNMENDMVNFDGINVVSKASEATADNIAIWGNSWSLPTVFGQSTNPPNANTKTLFTDYTNPDGLYSSAILYYNISYKPYIYRDTDFQHSERAACADGNEVSTECLYDYKATSHVEIGQLAIQSMKKFNELKAKLSNVAPYFTSNTLLLIHVKIDQSFTLKVEVADANHPAGSSLPDITLQATIKNAAQAEQLSKTTLTVTKDTTKGVYESSLDWRPTVRDKYIAQLEVTDEQGARSVAKPYIVLCACENDGICDYNVTWGVEDTFAYASCICPAGRTGELCEGDLNACADNPCYGGCTDERPSEGGKEYTCSPCPANMEGNGETCNDINQCLRPVGDTHRHSCNQTCTNTPDVAPHQLNHVDRGYICSCGPGFQLNEDGLSCDDIQECRKNPCDDLNGKCVDYPPGSYTCTCNPGFVMDPTIKKCVDKNECDDNNGGCERKCINNYGSFTCECGVGFKVKPEDKTKCIEVNECELAPECDQTCVDKIGFYECSCRSDFNLAEDGKRCFPKEGCTTLKCYPNVGANVAYCGISDITKAETCFCPFGYQITPANLSLCVDIDECTHNDKSCDANADCQNTIGSYTCQCKTGFVADTSDKKRCNDVDECGQDNSVTGCEVCVNNYGSYSCKCQPGYMLNSDGKTCTDINECAPGQPNVCSPLADCTNTNGSYNCVCKAGYQGTGDVCTDINECQTIDPKHQHNCEQDCVNTYGGFRCTCVLGHKVNTTDPTKCVDLNECESPGYPCDHQCTNTYGSYKCSCDANFELASNGKTCQAVSGCEENCGEGACYITSGVKRCKCKHGYDKGPRDLDECLDINECTAHTDKCVTSQQAVCVNYAGTGSSTDKGYICSCKPRYTINEDKVTCRDINECQSRTDKCDAVSTTCVNTIGSNKCECRTGFTPLSTTHCEDINECTQRTHNCMRKKAVCINTPGTFTCKCIAGYQGNGTVCMDINECDAPDTNNCNVLNQNCVNIAGSYHCTCKAGYKLDYNTNKCVDIDECNSPILNKCQHKPGCINQDGGYRCTCYQGAVLANDGRNCQVTSECINPAPCEHICVRLNAQDTCICQYPYKMQNGKCTDINECTRTVNGVVNKPCDESHSICVDKGAGQGFECQCLSPWLPDIDGRGCSETDGLWGAWTAFSNCSRNCHGRQIKTRICNIPPPRGFGRKCNGTALDYKMCNMDLSKCTVDPVEIESSVELTFNDLEVYHWEDVSPAVSKGVADQLNTVCRQDNITYQSCCNQQILQENIPSKGEIVTAADIRIVEKFPIQYDADGTKVMIYYVIQNSNTLCPKSNTAARKKRSLDQDGEFEVLHRSKRALDITPNSTFSLLSQNILHATLEDNRTRERILLYLDDENLLDQYGSKMVYQSQVGALPTTTTKAPPEVVEADTGLPMWAIATICAVLFVAFILFIIMLIVINKRLKKADDEKKLRPESAVSRVDMANDESDNSNLGSRASLSTTLTGGSLVSLREDADLDIEDGYVGGSYYNERSARTDRSRVKTERMNRTRGDVTDRMEEGDNISYREGPDDESVIESRPVSHITKSMGPSPIPYESRPASVLPGAIDHSEGEDGSDNNVPEAVVASGEGKKKKKKKKKKSREDEDDDHDGEPKKSKKKKKPPSY